MYHRWLYGSASLLRRVFRKLRPLCLLVDVKRVAFERAASRRSTTSMKLHKKEVVRSMERLYAVPSEKLRVWSVWLSKIGEIADEWQRWLRTHIDLIVRIAEQLKATENTVHRVLEKKEDNPRKVPTESERNPSGNSVDSLEKSSGELTTSSSFYVDALEKEEENNIVERTELDPVTEGANGTERPNNDAAPEGVDHTEQPKNDAAPEGVDHTEQPNNDAAPEGVDHTEQPNNDAVPERVNDTEQPKNDAAPEGVDHTEQPNNDAVPERVNDTEQPKNDAAPEGVDHTEQPNNDAAPEGVDHTEQPKNDAAPEGVDHTEQPNNDAAPEGVDHTEQPNNDAAPEGVDHTEQPKSDAAPEDDGGIEQPRNDDTVPKDEVAIEQTDETTFTSEEEEQLMHHWPIGIPWKGSGEEKKIEEKEELKKLPIPGNMEEMEELAKKFTRDATLYRSYYKHWRETADLATKVIGGRLVLATFVVQGNGQRVKKNETNKQTFREPSVETTPPAAAPEEVTISKEAVPEQASVKSDSEEMVSASSSKASTIIEVASVPAESKPEETSKVTEEPVNKVNESKAETEGALDVRMEESTESNNEWEEVSDLARDSARADEPIPYFFYLKTEPDLEIAIEQDDEDVILADTDREKIMSNYEQRWFNLVEKPGKGDVPTTLKKQ
ncbi:uncharacterized protein LOC143153090 isoform X2 [Ptiloglossa arizonensis]|uniref:uncharacterized protein LOC143153090 isoform X2 n=1 Tax=Ptiloglossa arizonensis TaxID=3350558 RepID=UPI003F9ED4EE